MKALICRLKTERDRGWKTLLHDGHEIKHAISVSGGGFSRSATDGFLERRGFKKNAVQHREAPTWAPPCGKRTRSSRLFCVGLQLESCKSPNTSCQRHRSVVLQQEVQHKHITWFYLSCLEAFTTRVLTAFKNGIKLNGEQHSLKDRLEIFFKQEISSSNNFLSPGIKWWNEKDVRLLDNHERQQLLLMKLYVLHPPVLHKQSDYKLFRQITLKIILPTQDFVLIFLEIHNSGWGPPSPGPKMLLFSM